MNRIVYMLSSPIRFVLRKFLPGIRASLKSYYLFNYDRKQFRRHSGSCCSQTREANLAVLIMTYHQIEKGLTMPRRRLGFGRAAVLHLMDLVDKFERSYGGDEPQWLHAIGTVRAYYRMHVDASHGMTDDFAFWKQVKAFDEKYGNIPAAIQRHVSKKDFYAFNEESFPFFARSRHTSRHFFGGVDSQLIEKCVDLAMTTPSACNRQHARVHCISNHFLRDSVFALQNGNRGFGSDADKLLILTADLQDVVWDEERNDIFTNVGMFAMNLCYALHYHKIAHCILNGSVPGYYEDRIKQLVGIPSGERLVLMIACGDAPKEFDVATSPRKNYRTIYTEHI